MPLSLEELLAAGGATTGSGSGPGSGSGSGEEGLCVVGVFGRSAEQLAPLKESLLNSLADKHVFSVFGEDEEDPDPSPDPPSPRLQAVLCRDSRVLYLLLHAPPDRALLLRAVRAAALAAGHAEAQQVWKVLDQQVSLHLLYLFSLSHVLLLVQPGSCFDVFYDRMFRALDALRQKLLPLLRAALKDCPVSKEWKLNCRPCPPRLLFVFQMNGALKVPVNGSDSILNSDRVKKHSPRRRLQHALEDQIYRIFRKSRVLTNQSSNCLFTVPANQAFVYVIPAPEEDPVAALLTQLRSNCVQSDQEGAPAAPRRYQQLRRCARPPLGGDAPGGGTALPGSAPQDGSLKDFLWQHVELVLTKKGFDDSVGRNPQPSHFELPTLSRWTLVAQRLQLLLLGGGAGGGGGAGAEEELAELSLKVQAQLKVLDGFLDADSKFSESRCQKALPLAHSAYQNNLPHNYTTSLHQNQLSHALRVYSLHARGVAFQRYARQLHDDCCSFWSNGHQLCEERSLTDQHCVHKAHLLPQNGEKPDVDHNPPILHHTSRGRSTSSCNCGRKQAPREDPFDIQAANYDFYQALEEKCCGKLERIDFPVFQPSTPDPAPASAVPGGGGGGASGAGEAERLKESGAVPSHTPGSPSLSLALSLGQSSDSLGYDAPEADAPKRRSLVDRQPSTVEYLPGMTHSGCPAGLLPKFSSWSLVRLGPAKSYNCNTGLEQPGFLPGANFLLPWDLVIRSRSEEEAGLSQPLDASSASSWPAPNKTLVGKRGGLGGPGRGRRRDDVARMYVGFEYEDGRGRRFISCGPDKIVKVLGPGGAKEPASRVLSSDMPLYVPAPSQGRGLKQHYAQLARLYILVPDAALEVTLSPQVQPGPPPCPLFHPEQAEVLLPPDGLWVLRLPFSYCTERGPCLPPKENQPLSNYKVLRGILKASPTNPPPQ